ncbi:MAG: aldo/keto reductase [Candidatus Heimdallarchaeota archaeon]|nr:aldo/keto reductase [Candidatus Heimdallarchaeota archaeon]
MDYKKLGSTGLKVSPFCLGTMQFGWTASEEESFAVMNRAWDAGINFFDTANVYSRWSDKSYPGKSEEIIGQWIKESGNRQELILATKVRGIMGQGDHNEGLSRRHIIQQITGSLKRLQTTWIDLYQSHAFDEATPVKETLEVYTDLIRDGKVNYIGASNYPAWRLMESLWISEKYNLAKYQTLQPYYSLVRRHKFEPELMDVCVKYQLGVIPYSPLAAGFLTGKYRKNSDLPSSDRADGVKNRYFGDRGFNILEELSAIATDKGITIAQGALSWVMHQEGITSPIIGANSVDQLDEILEAKDVTYTKAELERLDQVSSNESNMIIT